MQYATSYQHCHDWEYERASLAEEQRERAVDHEYQRLKRDPEAQNEVLAAVWDSGVIPENAAHALLIDKLASLDASLMFATDAESVRRRMLTLDAIIQVAIEDEMIRRAEAEVSA